MNGEQTIANFYPCNPGSPSPPALSDCPDPGLVGPTPDLKVDVVGGTCNPAGDSALTVSVNGTASTPFSGTYSETLTWTVGAQTLQAVPAFFPFAGGPPAESVGLLTGPVTSLTANYTITAGSTTITGTKTLVDNPGNWGVCRQWNNEPAEGPILNNAPLTGAYYILGAGVLSYTAHIVGPGGTTDETGLAASYLNNSYATCCNGVAIQNAGAAGHLREGFGMTFPAPATSSTVPSGTGAVSVTPLPAVTLKGTVDAGNDGNVTAILRTSVPTLPAGFQVGDPPAFYELDSQATFTGPVEVCIGYGDLPSGMQPKLLHYENGTWVDVTTRLQPPNQVCGNVTSFSPFAAVFAPPAFTVSGPFAPVGPYPNVNPANAGRTIPVKFSLGGDFGLGVLASGYPQFTSAPCNGGPTTTVPTVSEHGLVYDPTSRTYTYNWKTPKSFAGRCGTLTVRLTDGEELRANFKFS